MQKDGSQCKSTLNMNQKKKKKLEFFILPVKSTSLAREWFDSLGGTNTSKISFSSGSGEKNSRQTDFRTEAVSGYRDFYSNTMKIYYIYPTMDGSLIIL